MSLASLGANLLILEALVEAGLGAHKVAAQAVAINRSNGPPSLASAGIENQSFSGIMLRSPE